MNIIQHIRNRPSRAELQRQLASAHRREDGYAKMVDEDRSIIEGLRDEVASLEAEVSEPDTVEAELEEALRERHNALVANEQLRGQVDRLIEHKGELVELLSKRDGRIRELWQDREKLRNELDVARSCLDIQADTIREADRLSKLNRDMGIRLALIATIVDPETDPTDVRIEPNGGTA